MLNLLFKQFLTTHECGRFLAIYFCEVCGCTDVTVETSHEGMKCACCGGVFDCWEDGQRNTKTGQLICNKCFSQLKD